MFNNSRAQSQHTPGNPELEQVQVFPGKLMELLGEQAQNETFPDAVAVAFLARAMDFAHFTLGKEDAKRLTLHILEDMQGDYDFKRN